METYGWKPLHQAVATIFRSAGSGEREAGLVADQLVEANLRGHDSHGVGMVPRYVENVLSGDLHPNSELVVSADLGAMLVCDGQRGFGQVMGHDAMALGIERAGKTGTCIVSLRDSHHLGRIGHWAEQCAEAGLVSVHFVNVICDPLVVPFGGTTARMGTNPFTAGFPRENGAPPIVVDFATSRLAFGKVRVAHNKDEDVEPGVLLTSQGHPTTDPSVMFDDPRGALLTFGEHKGSALSLACELLGGAVSGATVQSGPPADQAILNSMFSVLIDPAHSGLGSDYAGRTESVLRWFQSENSEDLTGVRLPGDPERDTRKRRTRDGIPIDPNTMAEIHEAANRVGVTSLDLG
ncbi:MAG: malate/lactate/ureidoglycolate dehydrogenase [Hyphomicrobiales bacterium]|nr:malate/lactate/ureidoglycolate dehydrogenase [Hyphomicrobiales bacterium]